MPQKSLVVLSNTGRRDVFTIGCIFILTSGTGVYEEFPPPLFPRASVCMYPSSLQSSCPVPTPILSTIGPRYIRMGCLIIYTY